MNYGNDGVSLILLPAKGGCSTSPDGQTCFDSLFAVGGWCVCVGFGQATAPSASTALCVCLVLVCSHCVSLLLTISDHLQWVIMHSYQLLCFAGFHLPFRFLSYSAQCV